MRSSCREDIVSRFDALHVMVSELLDLSFDALTTPECLRLLERLEREARRLPVAGHALINQLSRQASETELGGKIAGALANRLRIPRAEASRRIHEAEDLGQRTARRAGGRGCPGGDTGRCQGTGVPAAWPG